MKRKWETEGMGYTVDERNSRDRWSMIQEDGAMLIIKDDKEYILWMSRGTLC